MVDTKKKSDKKSDKNTSFVDWIKTHKLWTAVICLVVLVGFILLWFIFGPKSTSPQQQEALEMYQKMYPQGHDRLKFDMWGKPMDYSGVDARRQEFITKNGIQDLV